MPIMAQTRKFQTPICTIDSQTMFIICVLHCIYYCILGNLTIVHWWRRRQCRRFSGAWERVSDIDDGDRSIIDKRPMDRASLGSVAGGVSRRSRSRGSMPSRNASRAADADSSVKAGHQQQQQQQQYSTQSSSSDGVDVQSALYESIDEGVYEQQGLSQLFQNKTFSLSLSLHDLRASFVSLRWRTSSRRQRLLMRRIASFHHWSFSQLL